jgi:hypothetical protein
MNRYYEELQLIDEFHATFIPTKESEARKLELLTIINNNIILDNATITVK